MYHISPTVICTLIGVILLAFVILIALVGLFTAKRSVFIAVLIISVVAITVLANQYGEASQRDNAHLNQATTAFLKKYQLRLADEGDARRFVQKYSVTVIDKNGNRLEVKLRDGGSDHPQLLKTAVQLKPITAK